MLLLLAGVLGAHSAPGNDTTSGEQVFRRQCAVCHGDKGEGTKLYQKPLVGSKSVDELTHYIAQSMPPKPRKRCTAEDAKRVAAYLYDAFYSPLAQARNRPARIALARLTVRQYRNTLADLIGSFRNGDKPDDRHGLQAEYFKAKQFNSGDRVLQRLDPEVHFDFGRSGPVGDQFDPNQFSIRWQGGVLAPDTGEYDFVVRTDHAARLWVNDMNRPLIDASIKSGTQTEYRASLTLLGGRIYPLRLEFSKGTTGVDDTAQKKGKPAPPAFVDLVWRRPKQVDEVIPQRCLTPVSPAETYVVTTPFPPDDRSTGYERGTSVSKEWDEAATSAAFETADYVKAHLRELAGVGDNDKDRPARVQAFCKQFVERAFRRPLTPDVAQLYVDRQFKNAPDLEAGVKRSVVLTLNSPRFLYPELDSPGNDSYATACRLSYGLWDSLPDQTLLQAAAAGQLATRDQVKAQAERMVADPRAWAKLREFFLQWLRVDQGPDLAKDAKRFPDFDAVAASDLRTSLDLFLQSVVWNDRSDYRDLLLTDRVYLNGRLAKLYGANLPADAPFQAVTLDPDERAGVLTQPYLLASFAYLDTSSPIHRGVLIMRNVLGRTLKPPPAAFAPLPASQHPDLTTRQRVEMQTRPAFCNACHGKINPLGFTLERFDAIGRVRKAENGHPIDSTGVYQTRAGETVHFSGAKDLARYIAGSDDAHAAFVEKLFQYLIKQPVLAYGPKTPVELERSFEADSYNIRKLMVDIMSTTALTPYNSSSNHLSHSPGGITRDLSKHPSRISPQSGSQRGGSAVPDKSALSGRSEHRAT